MESFLMIPSVFFQYCEEDVPVYTGIVLIIKVRLYSGLFLFNVE